MYCKQCGEKLTLRFCENEGLVPYCDKCEAYKFPQFNVAVSMVVTNRAQDKILLAKHVEDEDFILFAGYIKKGENAEKTVPREIKEELGFDVVKSKYMSSRYHSQRDVLMLNFIVVVEEKPIKLNEDEIAEARWCTPEEAVALIRKGTTAEFFLLNAVKELKRKIKGVRRHRLAQAFDNCLTLKRKTSPKKPSGTSFFIFKKSENAYLRWKLSQQVHFASSQEQVLPT